MSTIISLALRGAQALFAIIIIGLTANLIKGQVFGGAPAPITFTMFAGAFGLLGALIGVASNWVELLQSVLMAGIDALAAFFYLAGGVVLAYKLRGINCSSSSDITRAKMFSNNLLNGGCSKDSQGNFGCGYGKSIYDPKIDTSSKMNERCKMNEADAAFMFMSVILLIASVTVLFLHLKRHK